MVEMESVILYSLLTESFPQVANNGWRQHPMLCHWQKKKCWDQWEQIFASSVLWLFSDGGLKKTDLLEHNVHADGIHMWCCNANRSDSPLFGILVILTDFLMYFNWQSYFQSSEAEIHQNDQMRAWVMHGMFQGVLSDIVHYGSIFYYRREPYMITWLWIIYTWCCNAETKKTRKKK